MKKNSKTPPTTVKIEAHEDIYEIVTTKLEKPHLQCIEMIRRGHFPAVWQGRIENRYLFSQIIDICMAHPKQVSQWFDEDLHYAELEGFREAGGPGLGAVRKARLKRCTDFAGLKTVRKDL